MEDTETKVIFNEVKTDLETVTLRVGKNEQYKNIKEALKAIPKDPKANYKILNCDNETINS